MSCKEKYYERKSKGLCVHCGRKAVDGKVCCEKCLEYGKRYKKKRVEKRKAEGRCVTCGEKINNGKVRCETCLKLAKIYNTTGKQICDMVCDSCKFEDCVYIEKPEHKKHKKVMSQEQREKQNKYLKERYEYRKKNGICVTCGEKAKEGRIRCEKCLIKKRIKETEKRRTKFKEKGTTRKEYSEENNLCYLCLKEKRKKSKKVCEKCYQKTRRALTEANKKLNELKKQGVIVYKHNLNIRVAYTRKEKERITQIYEKRKGIKE